MTFDEVKKKLKEYTGLKKLLEAKQTQIDELREGLAAIRATDYAKEKVCSSGSSDYIETILDRIARLEGRANTIMQRIFDIEDLIAENMDELSDVEQAIVIDRYMNDMSWAKICKKYYFSYEGKGAQKVLNRAIRKIANKKSP